VSSTRDVLLDAFEKLKRTGEKPVAVLDVARAANISRSSIYKYHPDILLVIRAYNFDNRFSPEPHRLKASILARRLTEEKLLVSNLTKVCSELLQEIIEFHDKYREDIQRKDLKIAFLERSLEDYKLSLLKVVK